MTANFENVEAAYRAIGLDVAAFPNGRDWDEVCGRYDVLGQMVSSRWWLQKADIVDKKWNNGDEKFNGQACRATQYLRDYLLKTTKQKIWGLTFTLYPTGKFKIDYDYNKPEGYEETEEAINLSDAVERLQQLGVDVQVTEKKK